MYITFLGTSSGMPTLRRNVTAIAVAPSHSKRWYLVDCGEATQHQLLRTRLSMLQLQAIFITHIHGDHCYGLPGLLASAATVGRIEPLNIIAPAAIKEFVMAVCEYTQLHLTYPLNFHAVEKLDCYEAADYGVTATELSHRVPSFGYTFFEQPQPGRVNSRKLNAMGLPPGPLWGRLQNGEDVTLDDGCILRAAEYITPARRRRIIIGGDNDKPELLREQALGVDLLVHEATYTEVVAKQVEPGPQHSSARSVAEFAAKARVPNLILTHFSKRYHQNDKANLIEIRQEAQAHYAGNLFLANDLDVFELTKDGEVRLMEAHYQRSPDTEDRG